jgi:group I intron endonuclease
MNKLNEKIYIGKSKDALKRYRIHLKIAKGGKEKYPRKFQAIHAAISKYGIENFTFEILHETKTEIQSFDLEVKEISLIPFNKKYNLSDGGEGNSGWKHTDVSKSKMSKSRKGKTFTEEHKEALSKAQSGNLHSQFGKHQTIKWKEAKSKLTAEQVKEIKSLLTLKIKQKEIAKKYNVSVPTVSMIKHGKIWSDII